LASLIAAIARMRLSRNRHPFYCEEF